MPYYYVALTTDDRFSWRKVQKRNIINGLGIDFLIDMYYVVYCMLQKKAYLEGPYTLDLERTWFEIQSFLGGSRFGFGGWT